MGARIGSVHDKLKKEFDQNKRVLTFDEYVGLIAENPARTLRGSAGYLLEMMDYFGKTALKHDKGLFRFKIFDEPVDGIAPKVVGHERVQNEIYRTLKNFVRQGLNNQLILLHGPNGSAKSTLIHALMNGMEKYSETSDGATYTFNWVFPLESVTKGKIGIGTPYPASKDSVDSYAKLPDDEIAAKLTSELKDHPFLLIPKSERLSFLTDLIGREKAQKVWSTMPHYLTQGDLDQRSKMIFDALLISNNGDYRKVLKHIQVERYYYSRRYRRGLVTIEPQMHVDASYGMLAYNKNISSLPPSLQSLNFFTVTGDLVDGNRGIVEYSDLLKRPIDTFKYLLTACETGTVSVGPTITSLDAVLLGSTNELQLDAFKEFPDFSSFKARIHLIRVPYLLSPQEETEIYSLILPQVAGEKPITPHVAWTAGLWAVLTRLKKPNPVNYPGSLNQIISNLTPLDKARIYDGQDLPFALGSEEKKQLRSQLENLKQEYGHVPYYEGRIGASVREIKNILYDAANNPQFPTLSPLAFLQELELFVNTKTSEYEFLKQEVKDNYHDAREFINVVTREYLDVLDREVKDSIGIYESFQWEELLKKYVQNISAVLKKEKVKNKITGRHEDPDSSQILEVETILGSPLKDPELEEFRKNIISQVGAWSLDHPNEPVNYREVFPEYWKKIEKHYFEAQKGEITKMAQALNTYELETGGSITEAGKLARQTVEKMKSKYGYTEEAAKEVIAFLVKKRY